MEAKLVGAGVRRTEGVAHLLGPDAPGGPELADLFEEVVVHVEKEAEPGREFVHIQAPFLGVPYILETVGKGECQLLHRVRPGLPDVVAADADRVPARYVARAELHGVCNETHRRRRREHVLVLGDVLLQNVVLDGPADLVQRRALLLGQGKVHGPDDGGRGIDGHRSGDLVQPDAVEQRLHVGQRRHGHAAGAELAEGSRVVGVVAVQGRHVEGYGQSCLPLVQQELEALVGLLRPPEPREHAECPQPAPVAGVVDAAQVGKLARQAHRFHVALAGGVCSRVELVDRQLGRGAELGAALCTRVLALTPVGSPFVELLQFLIGNQGATSGGSVFVRYRITVGGGLVLTIILALAQV